MEYRAEQTESTWSVVAGGRAAEGHASGGRFERAARLLVIDIDDPSAGGPRLSGAERRELAGILASRRFALAVATAYTPIEVERACRAAGLPRPAVVHLAPEPSGGRALPSIPDQLASAARALGTTLGGSVAIAAAPGDLPLLMEAGTALALGGAGSACIAAADLSFPERASGGLVRALAALRR